jgi:hypothetical protein
VYDVGYNKNSVVEEVCMLIEGTPRFSGSVIIILDIATSNGVPGSSMHA